MTGMALNRVLAGLLALVLLLGVQTYRLAAEQRDHASARAHHAEIVAAMERGAREAIASARAEEQRRTAEVQKVADEANQAMEQARADADAAADVGRRLRAQLAAVTAASRGSSVNTEAVRRDAPAEATADLLAHVQRRLDEAADGIARFADQARAAGVACERSYEALTSDPAALHR